MGGLRTIHPHGLQHTFGQSDSLPPASGTLQLYVDGTAGDDSASGQGGWVNAWKTNAKLLEGLRDLFQTDPLGLIVHVHARGSFGATDHLRGVFDIAPNCRIVIGCDAADCTVVQTGTVNAFATFAGEAAVLEVDFTGGGIALTGNEHKTDALVQFDDGVGGHKATYQILWPDAATNKALLSVAGSAKPAWLLAGATAKILAPGLVIEGEIDVQVQAAMLGSLVILNARTYNDVEIRQSMGVNIAVQARNAAGTLKNISLSNCNQAQGNIRSLTVPVAVLEAYGYIGIGGVAADYRFGCVSGPVTAIDESWGSYYCGYAERITCSGKASGLSYGATSQFKCGDGDTVQMLNSILLPGTSASYPPLFIEQGRCVAQDCNVLGVPAAGFPGPLVECKGGRIILDDFEGVNTGTAGSGLFGVRVAPGAKAEIDDITVTKLKAKHGNFRNEGGVIEFTANSAIGSSEGGGPDIYNEGGEIQFDGNFNKTVKNTTASAFIQSMNGKIHQVAGKTMTIVTPAADWATDFGAGGAIRLDLTEARLGTLTGGAAGTTGVACTLGKGTKMVHAGAGLLGAAPLKLGGADAQAWPAAPTSDLAAAVPEDCWIYPNVA